MEFLRAPKRRSNVSDIAYIALNIALVVVLFVVAHAVDSLWLLIGIVLLSKWRIFAVRPRYWAANLMSNLVDIIVGIGYVTFLYGANDEEGAFLIFQIGISVLYALWLLVIKPRSSRSMMAVQALTSLFVGTTTLGMLAYKTDAVVFVIGMWIIAYAGARHVLSSYDEQYQRFFSLVWALVIAELGWLGYHWQYAYKVPSSGDFKLMQLALVSTLFGFLAERVYASYAANQRVRIQDVVMPLVFVIALVGIILIGYNQLEPDEIV